MTLAAGTRLGPYEILSLIGAGGMGEVYKARDTRLERQVAIKLLHPEFATRPDRRARFEMEARAISALGHPHICTLFDVGEQDGRAFLVMELLEGETLDDRLTRGSLPAADLLRYATEIASALAHAHGQHIVHRDVKPSNVMLTASGAKLLDFGVAKSPALAPVASPSTLSLDQRDATAEGTMIGTFQYMAPEQLEGRPVDARTDIFGFGAVVYEMATGNKAFDGSSHASLIAAILTANPPSITSSRGHTTGDRLLLALDHIIERCLAKDPDQRWQTVADVKLELEWIARGGTIAPAPGGRSPSHVRETVAWMLAVAAVAAVVVLVTRRSTADATMRFVITPPPGTTIGVAENRTRLAISPDGRRLAFVAATGGRQQIWVRSLDSLASAPLAGTDGAVSPFWSPDSRFVGFFSPGDGALKKVEIAGGPARTICAAQIDGAPVWGPDGTILFTQFLSGIYRVPADGGMPVAVTQLDKGKRELNHYWPEFLPDGRHFLYMATALENTGVRATPSVYVASLDTTETTLLARMHSRMVYAEPGFVLFVQDGALLAQPFDAVKLRLTGEPRQIADGVAYVRTLGAGGFTASRDGMLAYQNAGDVAQLVAYDRRGNATPTGWTQQNYGTVRFSPNGRNVVVDVLDPRTGTADIWIYDVARGVPVRFTSDPADESGPVWSPDGSRIMLRMSRGGPESLRLGSAAPNIYAKPLSGAPEELLVADTSPLQTEDWSGDGEWVAYTRSTRQTGMDIWLMPTTGDRKAVPLSNERFDEWGASFSPDSKWLAFASTESGEPEVYVSSVRHPRDKKRISTAGGSSPRWRADGKELFYAAADNRAVMAVTIDAATELTAGIPARLFSVGPLPAVRGARRNMVYDASPDGQHFLVSVPSGELLSSRITVVSNWTSALEP
jgi:eukaryotic-like serine/threonine-protein kinase